MSEVRCVVCAVDSREEACFRLNHKGEPGLFACKPHVRYFASELRPTTEVLERAMQVAHAPAR